MNMDDENERKTLGLWNGGARGERRTIMGALRAVVALLGARSGTSPGGTPSCRKMVNSQLAKVVCGALVSLTTALIIGACSGAPDYCDSCKNSAYACQHASGKVTCHDSSSSASSACGNEPNHHIGKCN